MFGASSSSSMKRNLPQLLAPAAPSQLESEQEVAEEEGEEEDEEFEDEDEDWILPASRAFFISVSKFDSFVSQQYGGRPYNFQQQDGSKQRGIEIFHIPYDIDAWHQERRDRYTQLSVLRDLATNKLTRAEAVARLNAGEEGKKEKEEYNEADVEDMIAEIYEDFEAGIHRWGAGCPIPLDQWIRTPLDWSPNNDSDVTLFWEREYYPAVEEVLSDLRKKKLIGEGKLIIHIDW